MLSFKVYEQDTLVAEYRDDKLIRYVESLPLNYKIKGTPLEFLTSRVLPKHRWNQDEVDWLGIPDWDPLEICKRTHGAMPADFLWVKFPFDKDNIKWSDVRV